MNNKLKIMFKIINGIFATLLLFIGHAFTKACYEVLKETNDQTIFWGVSLSVLGLVVGVIWVYFAVWIPVKKL
jgi:hypothetical protein